MSRGNRSRNLDITVGQLLVVLLWLLVLAAGECGGDRPVAPTAAPGGASAARRTINKAQPCGISNTHLRECSRCWSAMVTVRPSLP